MLDQHAEETFHAAKQGAVHHVGPLELALRVDEGQVEALRQVEIKLYRRKLPFAAQCIAQFEINLGAVERSAAEVHLVGQRRPFERGFQGGFGLLPGGRLAHRFLGPGAQVGLEIVEAEGAQHVQAEIEHEINLGGHLVGAAEVVGVILGEAAHSQQAVQHAAALIAVDRTAFGIAQRQVAVRTRVALVNVQVEGAVHRLEVILLALDIHRGVHVFFVKVQVPAGFPKLRLADVRRIDKIVVGQHVLLVPEILDQLAHHGSFGMPQNQPGADLIIDAEQVEIAAQLAMVAALGLFQFPQVFF